jgi:hypothetical protein
MKQYLLLTIIFFSFVYSQKSYGYKSSISVQSITEASPSIVYKEGILNLKGVDGFGNLSIYSIIGNPITAFINVDLTNFKRTIELRANQMYIVRIEIRGDVKTLRLVAR